MYRVACVRAAILFRCPWPIPRAEQSVTYIIRALKWHALGFTITNAFAVNALSKQPIGVFDSGVGGLSVLRAVRAALPGENLLYVADSANAPYGEKTAQFITDRSLAITQFLLDQQAKAIVVACNTATSAAIATLRARYNVPIIGMEPAIKPAVSKTGSGVVGVLATTGTVSSEKFAGLLSRFDRNVKIIVQPCPGLVEQVERGELDSDRTRALIQKYVEPLLRQGADTIVLGCTHYPFLLQLIQQTVGANVAVIEPSEAVAREVKRRLEVVQLTSTEMSSGQEQFWTSNETVSAREVLVQLWGKAVELQLLPA